MHETHDHQASKRIPNVGRGDRNTAGSLHAALGLDHTQNEYKAYICLFSFQVRVSQ